MRFSKTLETNIHEPWRPYYIDYVKLKKMLREQESEDDRPWNEDDEQNFCDEVFNTQLDKVAGFQHKVFLELQKQVDTHFDELKKLAPPSAGKALDDSTLEHLKALESELESVVSKVQDLRKYSSINYTGFLKIIKKHDRKRGGRYKIRPMMQLRLANRPFNSEKGYSPLLNKLSVMYFVIRQRLEDGDGNAREPPALASDFRQDREATAEGERYRSYKFWVHPENLLEVKAYVLRRLPTLVFSELSTSREQEVSDDPTITSLYFDSPKFQLYSRKVDNNMKATSLRLRWYGQLSANPTIMFEKKTVDDNGVSEEERFHIKAKYVKPFMRGDYNMEKTYLKMERQGRTSDEIQGLKRVVDSVAGFIRQNELDPVIRANYVRAAYQKPSDDRVRISIDTDIAFIREDALDPARPCRDPHDWHRAYIDETGVGYPFPNINHSEISLFPFALLEIKIKDDEQHRSNPPWVEDLMASHLVHSAPRFSKFVHGVASLCEDYVNTLPFWLSDMELDIRKDPQTAFKEEEERKAAIAAGDEVVGSFLGPTGASLKSAKSTTAPIPQTVKLQAPQSSLSPSDNTQHRATSTQTGYGSTSAFPDLAFSRNSRSSYGHKSRQLPEGIEEPRTWIKNAGPLKVEPKVWLANERTFLKWEHISILLGSMAVALYTAGNGSTLSTLLGVLYLLIAVGAGTWGWFMHSVRRSMIEERSGRDFDNMIGPMAVGGSLIVALVANFYLRWSTALSN